LDLKKTTAKEYYSLIACLLQDFW